MKIGILAEARYLIQNQPTGLSAQLQSEGHEVTVVDPQKAFYVMGDNRWFDGLDLIVGRGRSWALLALLGWAERSGMVTLNRQSAIAAVHNKAQMSIALAAGKLPIPLTFFGSIEYLAKEIKPESYPIILKPIFGDNSHGLLVVDNSEDLTKVQWPEPVALAQCYFSTSGYDLKLYGIGNEICAVRKRSPFNQPQAELEEGIITLTPELEDLGRRCGRLFDLDLFGVDCIETENGPLVIEINDYPNYTNVPQANERLASYVLSRARIVEGNGR
jgi:ribosomal protein S6--L-glutamate ligase